MSSLPNPSPEFAFRKIVSEVLARRGASIVRDVSRKRARHPQMSDRQIANLMIRSYRRRAGTAGALMGSGGAITLPVTVPTGLLTSWVFAVQTVLAVAAVYGYEPDEDQLLFDVLMVLAAESVVSTLQTMGTISAQHVTKKAIEKHVTREVMKKINRVVPRKVLTKAGEKSVTSFMKLAPLVGAPIGYGFEHVFITGVGRKAIDWYEPECSQETSHLAAA